MGREETKLLKEESIADIKKISSPDNNRYVTKTPGQIRQAKSDRYFHYLKKWTEYKALSTTMAQKKYCEEVLSALDEHTADEIKAFAIKRFNLDERSS